jgi:hypothetical protein
MTKQAQKHTLGLAGEFFVAAELMRRGILASVTYGNAKRADVIALSASGTKAVVVEVKSTSSQKWVIGNSVPEPSNQIWVLVHLPTDQTSHPSYFILTSRNLNDILMPGDAEYRKKFLDRNKVEYKGIGVVSLTSAQARPFQSNWSTIVDRVAVG